MPEPDQQPTALYTPDTTGGATTVPQADAGPSSAGLPRVPGFEILSVLGQGGMGVVYLARQVGLNRLVALKMIRAGAHAGARERQRFQIEAEAVARLQHPGIVQVHQIGEHEGMPFLVLEYVAGGPLSRHLGGQPQPAERCVGWMVVLARAVQAAHERGIIHRDLKPANVLLEDLSPLTGAARPEPERLVPKITDFGLAKEFAGDDGRESPTATGAVLGTPSYMAPEQAEGRTAEVGPPADVYALGAILYEMLTGRPPFRADTALNTLRQVVHDEPVAPRLLNPAVPPDLETICLKCLQKERSRRYVSARELAEDLERFQRGEPIRARPVGVLERGWRWVRRNPVVASLAAAVLLSLGLGLGFTLAYARQAEADAAEALKQKKVAEDRANEARLHHYLSETTLAGFAFREGEMARVRDLLGHWLPRPGEPDRRGPEWALLQRQERGALRVLEPASVLALAWHPSGRRLYHVADGRLVGRDLETGRAVLDVEAPPLPQALAVRPDGRQLALAADRRLLLLDADTGAVQYRGERGRGGVLAFQYRRDGRELAVAGADRAVRLHDPATGRLVRSLTHAEGHTVPAREVAYVGDGGHLVSFDVFGTFIRWDPARGRPVWRARVGGGVPQALAVHPTRPLAALGYSSPGRIDLFDLDAGQLVGRVADTSGGVLAVAFSPDGALLAGGDGRRVRLWDVRGQRWLDDGPPAVAEFAGHATPVARLAWSPDGWRFASTADSTVRLWSATASALERSWPGNPDFPVAVLHPLGACLLLLGGERPAVRVPLDAPVQEIDLPGVAGRRAATSRPTAPSSPWASARWSRSARRRRGGSSARCPGTATPSGTYASPRGATGW